MSFFLAYFLTYHVYFHVILISLNVDKNKIVNCETCSSNKTLLKKCFRYKINRN